MAPRRRGDRSRRLQAFQNDPKLLVIRPTPPSAGLNDLKPINLSTVLMAVHKHCYTSLNLTNKVAAPGGLQFSRRNSTLCSIGQRLSLLQHSAPPWPTSPIAPLASVIRGARRCCSPA